MEDVLRFFFAGGRGGCKTLNLKGGLYNVILQGLFAWRQAPVVLQVATQSFSLIVHVEANQFETFKPM